MGIPRPYLRQSTLQLLARKVTDDQQSENWYNNNTFEEAPRCTTRSIEEDDDIATSVKLSIYQARKEGEKGERKWDSDEDSDEYYDDDDDDDDWRLSELTYL